MNQKSLIFLRLKQLMELICLLNKAWHFIPLFLSAGGLCDTGVTVGNLAAEIMPTELKYVCY